MTFVELGHVAPAEMAPRQEQEVHAFVARVLDALGVESGATHTEIVLGSHGPRVIETHVRMGGDEIPALALDVTGVDLADCVVRQTVGEKVLPGIRAVLAKQRPGRSSAIWFAAPPAAGTLTGVAGNEEAALGEGVTAVELLVRPGAACGGLESSDSRLAYARALAGTAEEAVGAARDAVATLEFHTTVRATAAVTV